MNKVHLHVFYGVACTGKSTRAIHFAHEHAIRTIIPTDYVREVQRAYTRPPGGPLMKVTHNAWELFGELSSENIVKGFIVHVNAVAPALVAIVHIELVHDTTVIQRDVVISGKVIDAEKSNLFPRMFTLVTEKQRYPVYVWWWKFSTPVRENDRMNICGDKIMLEGREALRVTNFHNHCLAFDA